MKIKFSERLGQYVMQVFVWARREQEGQQHTVAMQACLCGCHLVAFSNNQQGCWEHKYFRNTVYPSCTRGKQCSKDNKTKYFVQEHFLFPKLPQSQAKLSCPVSGRNIVSVGVWVWSTRVRGRQMSCSVSWPRLTSVTTAASVELLLIYVGLPSETHPVKCLGCFQATPGKASLAGRKLKMVLWVVPFQHEAWLTLSPESRETIGCSYLCTRSLLPSQTLHLFSWNIKFLHSDMVLYNEIWMRSS